VVVRARAGALAVAAMLTAAAPAAAQSLTIAVAPGAVKVRAANWPFLTADPLARLREGRTVRVELSVLVLAAPGRPPVSAIRQIFAVSYDLWEERFAVSTTGGHAVSVSHLTAAAAEAWCLDQLAVPMAALAGVDDRRFWLRLECRILDGAQDPAEDEGLTLQRLIDVLSRRGRPDAAVRTIDGGPFRAR
jgi:hypothetical protein